ncbi:MAG TPA: class I SAM-dependent rRNA methyltransferase [Kofleriaceae bacterium]|jgi:23S rRNA (cytosine1962-C5)-methyltransferase
MATAPIRLRLKPEREKPLLQGHPWLFSGAIAAEEGPPDAALAAIVAADGRELGLGFHSPRSQIRARLPGVGVRAADRAFFAGRLHDALALRAALVPPDTTGYRVLNAEGDGLPGWTIDRFGDVLVSQIAVYGLEILRAEAYAALLDALPANAILQSNGLPARRLEGLAQGDEWISGAPRSEAVFTEAGLRFTADLSAGQKTGFYCDQRDSRRLVSGLAQGRRLLDLFAHSGAFGVHAIAGGADRVVHIESSPPLAERGRRHYEMNGLDPSRAEWVRADVFEDLRRRAERYDLVVCDPPPLARRRGDVERAARAYKDVNRLAMQRLAPGGFMLTFSCSGSIDGALFRQILFAAALEAGARVQLLRPLAAALDHPVAMSHREGEYLKGWLLRRQGEAAV